METFVSCKIFEREHVGFFTYIYFLDLKNRWDMSDRKIRICMAIEANIFVIFSFL